jgi:hypothetical protein
MTVTNIGLQTIKEYPMKFRLFLFVLVVVLTILAAGPVAAAPAFRPCAPGPTYDAACDVDHDGDVDIFDIQKAAGHWNQSGSWFSDNNHDHLGQVWTGASNPLVINGSFGLPTLAPLALSNSLGYGLSIPMAGQSGVAIGTVGTDGVFVNSAGSSGLRVASATFQGMSVGSAGIHGVSVESAGVRGVNVDWAGGDGVYVCRTGSAAGCSSSPSNNGVEIGSAEGNGFHVSAAGSAGVFVDSAGGSGVLVEDAALHGVFVGNAGGKGVNLYQTGSDGVLVREAGNSSDIIQNTDTNGIEVAGAETHGLFVGRADVNGIIVQSAGWNGLEVRYADYDGIHVTGNSLAAYFDGDIHYTGSCVFCRQATSAVNKGDRALAPGEVVALAGLQETDMDTNPLLLEVVPAAPGLPLVGVVAGRAELMVYDDPVSGETGQRLAPRDGPAAPGDYVTVVYAGPMQVRVDASEGAVAAGARLTASERPGQACAGRTVTVDGVELGENGPALGVALEPLATGEGLIWVLVNVQ